jgi:hypothetical protein
MTRIAVESPPVQRRSLFIFGVFLCAASVAMLLFARITFSAGPLPRPIYLIGFVSFWGFFPTGCLGVIIILLGLFWRRGAPR